MRASPVKLASARQYRREQKKTQFQWSRSNPLNWTRGSKLRARYSRTKRTAPLAALVAIEA